MPDMDMLTLIVPQVRNTTADPTMLQELNFRVQDPLADLLIIRTVTETFTATTVEKLITLRRVADTRDQSSATRAGRPVINPNSVTKNSRLNARDSAKKACHLLLTLSPFSRTLC